jgi:predicted component of type VI protein secretion system
MLEYGIGGTEVKGDASEAFAEIPQNRTLLCEKLTDEPPVKPQIVGDLQTIDDVFEHFKPKVNVEFEDNEGAQKQETLSFKGLSDFGIKGITAQSNFLNNLDIEKEQYQKIIKQLKSNRLLRKTLENQASKADLLHVIYALIKELEETQS